MKKKGFTLIEILASLTAFCIMFVAIGSVFYSVYLNWKKQRDINQNILSARWAMEFMSNEIRHANTSCISNTTTSLYFSRGADCSGGGSWKGICYSFDSSTYTLFRCEGNKKNTCSKACAAAQDILATSVADANFTVPEAEMAGIRLTVRPRPAESEGVGNRNITLETKVRGRN